MQGYGLIDIAVQCRLNILGCGNITVKKCTETHFSFTHSGNTESVRQLPAHFILTSI